MKSVKPRKAKLGTFTEEMTSGGVPVDPATATLIESHGEEAAPIEPAAVVVNETAAPAEPRRSKAPGGIFVLVLLIVLMVVAGPPIFLAMSALAYPAVLLLAVLAIWKIFDLFQKERVG